MLNGIDIVYWINLDRSPDRKKSMEELFSDSAFDDIKKVRFSAVDYKTRDVYKHFNLNEVGVRNNRPEYACFLSHLETIRTFANSKLPDSAVALIMEDDATLEYKPYWRTPIKDVLANAPEDWQIITLNYMFSEGVRIPNLNKFAEYEPNNGRFVSALSYLIRKTTAKEYMNHMYKNGRYYLNPNMLLHHADVYLFNTLNTYAYKYPYFTYKTENDSYLHPNDLDNHKRCKLQIAKMLYGLDYNSKTQTFIQTQSRVSLFNSNFDGFIGFTDFKYEIFRRFDAGALNENTPQFDAEIGTSVIFAALFCLIFVAFLYLRSIPDAKREEYNLTPENFVRRSLNQRRFQSLGLNFLWSDISKGLKRVLLMTGV